MEYWKNGQKYILPEPTAEELAQMEEERRKWKEEQKNLPPTESDRLEALESALLELAEVMCNG